MKKNRKMLRIFCDIWFWFSIIVKTFFFILYFVAGIGVSIFNIGTGLLATVIVIIIYSISVVITCIIRYFILCVIDISETNEIIANNTGSDAIDNNTEKEIDKEDIDKKVQDAFRQYEENVKTNKEDN